ncbi:MAG: HNH endonuclease [Rhodospirillales bacterium]|nr:HNH endonuclease [Rhodospirillales bacterium]
MAKNGRSGKRASDSRRAYKGVCVRKDLRLAIYLRDSFRCVYCCADLHGAHPTDITLDHVVAESDGGSNEPNNLVTACRHCNSSRQDKPLARFAGPETRADIRRLTRRSIKKHRVLAKAIINGETEDPRGNI